MRPFRLLAVVSLASACVVPAYQPVDDKDTDTDVGLDSDTDDGGVSDGEEVVNGTDPLETLRDDGASGARRVGGSGKANPIRLAR